MAHVYEYERSLLPIGAYDINNPERVDGEGNQILLAKEIEAVFVGRDFAVDCAYTVCKVIFHDEPELTPEEKTVLDQLVASHKNNT